MLSFLLLLSSPAVVTPPAPYFIINAVCVCVHIHLSLVLVLLLMYSDRIPTTPSISLDRVLFPFFIQYISVCVYVYVSHQIMQMILDTNNPSVIGEQSNLHRLCNALTRDAHNATLQTPAQTYTHNKCTQYTRVVN